MFFIGLILLYMVKKNDFIFYVQAGKNNFGGLPLCNILISYYLRRCSGKNWICSSILILLLLFYFIFGWLDVSFSYFISLFSKFNMNSTKFSSFTERESVSYSVCYRDNLIEKPVKWPYKVINRLSWTFCLYMSLSSNFSCPCHANIFSFLLIRFLEEFFLLGVFWFWELFVSTSFCLSDRFCFVLTSQLCMWVPF